MLDKVKNLKLSKTNRGRGAGVEGGGCCAMQRSVDRLMRAGVLRSLCSRAAACLVRAAATFLRD